MSRKKRKVLIIIVICVAILLAAYRMTSQLKIFSHPRDSVANPAGTK